MPENIFKLYRPPKEESTDKKRNRGLWYNDDAEKRFRHIDTALSLYCDENNDDYDYLDLVWHIKNAVIGHIYISDAVYKGIKKQGDEQEGIWGKYVEIDSNGCVLPVKDSEQYRIIKGIIQGNTIKEGNVFDDKFLEIRKWTGNDYSGASLIFEHVIPAKIYIDELIRAYRNSEFDLPYFIQFRNNISVCIVTDDENGRLNKKWRNDMPGIKGLPPDQIWPLVIQNPFARYDDKDVHISIHGR